MVDYRYFLQRVMERLKTSDSKTAVYAIEATLKTLGESLSEEAAARLAVQLPQEVGLYLTVVDTNQNFDLPAFYEHAARREETGPDLAREHVGAVLSVVAEVIEPEALNEVLTHLPDEFRQLFQTTDRSRQE